MELLKRRFTFILKHNAWEKVWQSRTVDWKTVGLFHGHRAHPKASKGTLTASPPTHEPVFLKSNAQFVLLEPWAGDDRCPATLPEAASDAACPPRAEHPPPSSLKSKGAGLFDCRQEFLIQHGKGRVRREIQAVKTGVGSANRRSMMRKKRKRLFRRSCTHACAVRRVRACAHPQECLSLIRIYLLPFSQLFWEKWRCFNLKKIQSCIFLRGVGHIEFFFLHVTL